MTSQYRHTITCVKCGHKTTTDSNFSRWLRSQPTLASDGPDDAFAATDADYLWTQWKHNGNRLVENMMILEVKERQFLSRGLNFVQGRLIGYFDQLFRNERKTPTKELSRRANPELRQLVKLTNYKTGKKQYVRMKGAHVLQFSGTCPDDSSRMWWDGKPITEDLLLSLLRFEVNPDPDSKYHEQTGSYFRPISNNGKTHHRRHDTQHVSDLFSAL